MVNIIRHFPTSSCDFRLFYSIIYFKHHIQVFTANSENLMVQFRVFTKLMPFFQQNDENLVFLTSFFDVTSLMTLSQQNFCISTFTYDNSLTILKILSSSFKLFRSYSFFFFELYIYIIGFLETLYTSDVTNSGTHSLGYPVLFAYRPQL